MLSTETEQKIVASAEKLFYQRGRAGASMQDIADDAGINRTLLNYYFRTKDQLFEAVFRKALSRFVPSLAAMLQSDMTFESYVPNLVNTIIDSMLENPQIPIFVLQELTSNPDRMPQIIREMGLDPQIAIRKINTEMKMDSDAVDPRQMILNLLALCIFPFAARPVVTEFLYEGSRESFTKAMKERKTLLPVMFRKLMDQNQNP